MIRIRRADERGSANHGWLDTRHTFSFADYYDPRHMGFRALRVINEDRVQPSEGFGTHGHRDMEIISYVVSGALEHRDSMGSGSVLRPGDLQHMSAGTGVMHSEYNPSDAENVHFLQIWILPERSGLRPSYEQQHFSADERRNRLRLVASHDARDGALPVHQDVELYASLLDAGQLVTHAVARGRHAWIQMVKGEIELSTGERLRAGDGVALSDVPQVSFRAVSDTECLLFDLA